MAIIDVEYKLVSNNNNDLIVEQLWEEVLEIDIEDNSNWDLVLLLIELSKLLSAAPVSSILGVEEEIIRESADPFLSGPMLTSSVLYSVDLFLSGPMLASSILYSVLESSVPSVAGPSAGPSVTSTIRLKKAKKKKRIPSF